MHDETMRDETTHDETMRDETMQDETRHDNDEHGDGRPQPPADNPPANNGDSDLAVELFSQADVEKFRAGWREVQGRFVDDPREAVQDADHLVADVMRSLESTFTDRKQELDDVWQHGSTVETEDLRHALRRYRSFFDRLLNA